MMEKYNFTVGSRPQWTPELIKQLPYGTVLRCAFFIEDIFAYNGQKIECDSAQDIFVDSFYFTFKKRNRYAEIVSLPEINDKSAVERFTDEFNEACKNQDKSNCPLVEPKAGDMVEARIDGWPNGTWRNRKYLCKNSFGKFVCEYKDGSVERFDEIRLPQKSEVESKVKELIKNISVKDDNMQSVVLKHDIPILVEAAIKWGQANPDKI